VKKPLEILRLYEEHDYTLNGALQSRLAGHPDRPFLLCQDRTWSWREFSAAVEATARSLVVRGITRGDRVSVMGRNSDGHVLMFFALARLGAIMVPVNPEFRVEEARYVFRHAEVTCVVASTDTLEIARRACEGIETAPMLIMLDAGSPAGPCLHDCSRRRHGGRYVPHRIHVGNHRIPQGRDA